MDTGPEWKLRRGAFRHPFSSSALQQKELIIQRHVNKLCGQLEESACRGETVQIDKLFGKMTIDVICDVAFQIDMDELKLSQQFQVK